LEDNSGEQLLEAIEEARNEQERGLSYPEIARKFPQLIDAALRFGISQHRPLLSFLYYNSQAARTMHEGTRGRWTPLVIEQGMGISGLLSWIVKHGLGALNYGSFSMLQASSANVYAAILIFESDKLIRGYKKALNLEKLEVGPEFKGQKFSRVLRAAGNQYRHGDAWKTNADAETIDDAKVLADIGIDDVSSADVPYNVLRVVGGSSYFDFEESLLGALAELTKTFTASETTSGPT